MKVFRGLGNSKFRNVVAVSGGVMGIWYILKSSSQGSVEVSDFDSDRLKALDAEISANTSARIWNDRGMSIK